MRLTVRQTLGRSVVYAVAVNCLKNPTPNPNPHPIRNPTTNPIPNPNPTNPIPYSSDNLLLRRKLHYAPSALGTYIIYGPMHTLGDRCKLSQNYLIAFLWI